MSMTGTFTVARKPNLVVATLLFLLCIVPMIIYMIVQSRPDVYGWSIQVVPEGDGSVVTYSAQGTAGALIFQAVSGLPERLSDTLGSDRGVRRLAGGHPDAVTGGSVGSEREG